MKIFLVPPGGAIALLLWGASPCRTQWMLDHYERNGKVTQKYISAPTNSPQKSRIKTVMTKIAWVAGAEKVATTRNGALQSAPSLTGDATQAALVLGEASFDKGIPPQKASFRFTTRAVFRWQRRLVWDDTTQTNVPDPTDNPPPQCWILESASISGNSGGEKVGFQTNHPFGVPFSGLKAGHFALHESRITVISALPGQDFAIGPDHFFAADVSLNSSDLKQSSRQSAGTARWNYSAAPIQFAVLSRLRADHAPTDLTTDFNGAAPDSSTIAVGHKQTATHEHEADLVVDVRSLVRPGEWNSVGNVKMPGLPPMEIRNKAGVKNNAALLPPATPFNGTLRKGRALIGHLLSSDEIRDVEIAPKNTPGTGTVVHQVWDQNDDWTFNAVFIKPHAQLPVTFRPKFGEDKPITGHSLKFIVSKILVTGYDPAVNEDRDRYYTLDPAEVDAQASPPILLGPIETYAKFENPIVADSGGGVYQGLLKLSPPEDQLVEDVEFQAEDMGVYAAPTP